MNPNKLIS